MDRIFAYAQEIPPETDLLNTNRNVLIGLGMLMQEIFGTAALVSGLPCTQTSPASMNVQIGAGRIYSLQNLDNTAYSTLLADTAHQIVKQGIALDAQTLSCPAPGTSGNSIAYLIEAQYQDIDTNLIVLPYYNSVNPISPLSGPANSGSAQPTTRAGRISIIAKPGVSATTGTQVPPAADSGYTGLYVVTVAYGASTINNANIVEVNGAPFLTETLIQKISQTTGDARYLQSSVAASAYQGIETSGSFTPTWTGFSAPPTGNLNWTKLGTRVCLSAQAALLGTSNTTAMTLGGLPAGLIPAHGIGVICHGIEDNGAPLAGELDISGGSSTLQFSLFDTSSVANRVAPNFSGFTASGNKGLAAGWTIQYDVG